MLRSLTEQKKKRLQNSKWLVVCEIIVVLQLKKQTGSPGTAQWEWSWKYLT